ncbi:DUF397 domain-containing protein [Saccharopolyspora sp. WRP15-2]|uniref:DUF397 domain-containing protein n=1 Tax=Saccharopolyspora oryzae TaxID=2997343 RepID=A0ABT4UTM0_9PSEU|nr:DUF397 domain-containing protein [Saccharopolyspora oryzae]MDA3625055.1 DUF397 domain-containing protein [Saccharopolyspora oryzae]
MDWSRAEWRKSTRSGSTSNCVEVAWLKSSYSGAQGDCVEVALEPEVVGVRDSKDRGGAVLTFPRAQWVAFISGLRDQRR